MVTLNDVAREAGVAVSTASRALSRPGRVSRVTRERVQAVASRLGYQPNRIAQALPSGRTMMLALLVADITNPYNFGLIRGAEAQARAAGYTLVLGDTQESEDLERALLDRLGSAVDGFLLGASRLPDDDLIEAGRRRPIVLFNREAEGFASVVTDTADGVRQVVEHLVALGHRSIAYLAGPPNAWTDRQRWRALSDHASERGLLLQRCGPFSPTVAYGAAAADVGLATGATALVAFNDLLAIGTLRRLERRKVDVPGQVSVVGFDDIFGSDFCHPPLTTVSTPAEDAGRTLVDRLLQSPTDRPPSRTVLPTRLLVRESTGPVPG